MEWEWVWVGRVGKVGGMMVSRLVLRPSLRMASSRVRGVPTINRASICVCVSATNNEQRTNARQQCTLHTANTATLHNHATMHIMHCTHTHTSLHVSIIQSPLPLNQYPQPAPIAPLPNHVHSLRSFTAELTRFARSLVRSFARSLVHCNTGTGVSFNHRSWK